jgi:anti-sigma factor RsiW
VNHEATVELLSRFLDGEVTPREHATVEEWLENDHGVREIYEGLSRVRGSLRLLADAAAPAHLGALVQRRVALETEESGLWSRVERRLRIWPVGPAVLTPFAVILALAAMLYVFANGLARFERAREPVFVAVPEVRVVAGRQLLRHGGRWVESGLEAARVSAARSIVFNARERAEWTRQRPDLEPLAELGAVVIELDGEVVVLVFDSDAD